MGQVHSQVKPGVPYFTERNRLIIQGFQCSVNDGETTTLDLAEKQPYPCILLSGKYDTESDSFKISRADKRPLSFTLDPDTNCSILQVPYQPSLSFQIQLQVSVDPGHPCRNLTFVHGNSTDELLSAIRTPNHDNRVSLGSFEALDTFETKHLEFIWVWDAQGDKFGGQPIHISLFEEDNGMPRILGGASFWINERPANEMTMQLMYEMQMSPNSQTPNVSANAQDLNSVLMSPAKKVQVPYSMPRNTATDSKIIKAMRPTSQNLAQIDDGPQFRSALSQMERKIPALKARVKQLLKRSLMCRERLESMIEADEWLAASIQEASRHELQALQPIASWFGRRDEGGLSAIQRQRKVSLNEINTRIIEPLQKFYEYDIKSFEPRKRDFEEYSSQFYSWTSRYLSKSESRRGGSSDSKFAVKKKSFDVARWDYFTYLNEITGGLKQQILLQLFALAAQSLTDSHIALGSEMANRTRLSIDETLEDVKKAAKSWEQYRLEGLDDRRSLAEDAQISSNEVSSTNKSSPEPTQRQELSGTYKEGLLWASSRPAGYQETQVPNKQTLQNMKWHKYWIVQDGYYLREYSNWKQNADLHNEPINLLAASVRETKTNDRRFCFEVATPQYRRVYQATSDEEAKSWINSINRAITTYLSSNQESKNSSNDEEIPEPFYNKGDSNSSNGNGSFNPSPAHSVNSLHSPSGHGPQSLKPVSSQGNHSTKSSSGKQLENLTRKISFKKEKPKIPPLITSLGTGGGYPTPVPHDDILTQVQRIPSDRYCAECNTTRSVEWVSINLLLVLCIDCSGAHRSLGSHISKIRSLTLDIGAFTPSLQEALLSVSNSIINQIWEAKLPPQNKLSPTANAQTRLKFITEKYVEKRFIEEIQKPMAALRRAISMREIPSILAALASRANPNGVSDADEPLLIDALRCSEQGDTTFPAAEILIKNGATVPPVSEVYEGLSSRALAYLNEKRKQP